MALLLLFTALLAYLLRWRRSAGAALLAALTLLWTTAMPVVAERLAWSLERRHPAQDVATAGPADCAIVLGGAMSPQLPPRRSENFHEAIDRVIIAARLLRAGRVSFLLVAAGNQPWQSTLQPEAESIADFLVELGARRDQLLLDTQSRNTRENALHALALLQQKPCDRALLVTSAIHMPRALAVFRQAGLAVEPFPVDQQVVGGTSHTLLDWLPGVGALQLTTSVWHEYVGWWVYRWRGWA